MSRLESLMSWYTTSNLANGTTPAAFESHLRGLIRIHDGHMEGWSDPDVQRDQSVNFAWGHDHDFGSFALSGLMRDRHISIIQKFIEMGGLQEDLTDQAIMDVGCWTGGMSLLLSAMGARVHALEEVQMYASAAEYLAKSFGASVIVESRSLYDIQPTAVNDTVILSGVLYHVSDLVLALRIMYGCLKEGGTCLIETEVTADEGLVCRYCGPTKAIGNKQDRTRQRWNWLVPSVDTLRQMLTDVGFISTDIELGSGARAFAVARKGKHVDILRSGLSNRATP